MSLLARAMRTIGKTEEAILRAKGIDVKKLTCGCCTNGCVCHHHQDIPRGIKPKICSIHKHQSNEVSP